MLVFIFAALIATLDQFFKRWIVRTLEVGETGQEIIPGFLGLTLWENDGAMLNILSGQQWLLAGIAFGAAIVLIMIILRYNEGFWGTIGLASVLGGTVGNLIDRVFNDGKVVDMFRTLPFNFPIFNIADIFITLGFITFLIHFISLSFRSRDDEDAALEYAADDYPDEQDEAEYDEFPEIDSIVAAQAEQEAADVPEQYAASVSQNPPSPQHPPEPVASMPENYEPVTETTDSTYSIDSLEAELELAEDYDIDELLREYGFENDTDQES